MKSVAAILICLLALQTSTGVSARFLLDLSNLPLHGRHLRVDTRGEDPIGSDTKGKDPVGADTHGNGYTSKSLAGSQPFASQAPTMAPAPTVAVAAAPAFAADTQIVAPAAAMPLSQSATEDAASHGAAPVSAPAGEAAPAVPTLESQLGKRRLSEDTQGSDPKGADTRGADPVGKGAVTADAYSHPVFRQPTAAPLSAQRSTGGPVPLSTILYSQVPQPGKPTLAAAPTTAPGGSGAPTASQ